MKELFLLFSLLPTLLLSTPLQTRTQALMGTFTRSTAPAVKLLSKFNIHIQVTKRIKTS